MQFQYPWSSNRLDGCSFALRPIKAEQHLRKHREWLQPYAGMNGPNIPSEYIEKPCPGGKYNSSPCNVKASPSFAPHIIRSPGGQITSTRRSYNSKLSEEAYCACELIIFTTTKVPQYPTGMTITVWQTARFRAETVGRDGCYSTSER